MTNPLEGLGTILDAAGGELAVTLNDVLEHSPKSATNTMYCETDEAPDRAPVSTLRPSDNTLKCQRCNTTCVAVALRVLTLSFSIIPGKRATIPKPGEAASYDVHVPGRPPGYSMRMEWFDRLNSCRFLIGLVSLDTLAMLVGRAAQFEAATLATDTSAGAVVVSLALGVTETVVELIASASMPTLLRGVQCSSKMTPKATAKFALKAYFVSNIAACLIYPVVFGALAIWGRAGDGVHIGWIIAIAVAHSVQYAFLNQVGDTAVEVSQPHWFKTFDGATLAFPGVPLLCCCSRCACGKCDGGSRPPVREQSIRALDLSLVPPVDKRDGAGGRSRPVEELEGGRNSMYDPATDATVEDGSFADDVAATHRRYRCNLVAAASPKTLASMLQLFRLVLLACGGSAWVVMRNDTVRACAVGFLAVTNVLLTTVLLCNVEQITAGLVDPLEDHLSDVSAANSGGGRGGGDVGGAAAAAAAAAVEAAAAAAAAAAVARGGTGPPPSGGEGDNDGNPTVGLSDDESGSDGASPLQVLQMIHSLSPAPPADDDDANRPRTDAGVTVAEALVEVDSESTASDEYEDGARRFCGLPRMLWEMHGFELSLVILLVIVFSVSSQAANAFQAVIITAVSGGGDYFFVGGAVFVVAAISVATIAALVVQIVYAEKIRIRDATDAVDADDTAVLSLPETKQEEPGAGAGGMVRSEVSDHVPSVGLQGLAMARPSGSSGELGAKLALDRDVAAGGQNALEVWCTGRGSRVPTAACLSDFFLGSESNSVGRWGRLLWLLILILAAGGVAFVTIPALGTFIVGNFIAFVIFIPYYPALKILQTMTQAFLFEYDENRVSDIVWWQQLFTVVVALPLLGLNLLAFDVAGDEVDVEKTASSFEKSVAAGKQTAIVCGISVLVLGTVGIFLLFIDDKVPDNVSLHRAVTLWTKRAKDHREEQDRVSPPLLVRASTSTLKENPQRRLRRTESWT